LKPFSIKPFSRGVLKDIPPQSMPVGGLVDGRGIRVTDAYVERRKGYRRLNDCEGSDYILGVTQFRDLVGQAYIFFGDRNYLYKLPFGIMREWDDGYPWWDEIGYAWDPFNTGIYRITPNGEIPVCPFSSVSLSESSSSMSSSVAGTPESFTGRDRRIDQYDATKWSFAPWGNNLLASNYEEPIQIIPGAEFDRHRTLVSHGLRARIVDVFAKHVIALNTVDELDGAVPNRWWWSGLDNAEDWRYDDPASEGGFQTLQPNSQPITGGAALRDSYVIFQEHMTHLVNYVGGTLVFSKQVVNSRIGALSQGLVQSAGDVVIFFGQNNIYRFDGYSFDAIGEGNNRWIFKGLNMAQVSQSFSFIDRSTKEAWFVIPHYGDRPNLACIYDITNNLWTFEDIDASAGCTQDGLDYPTIARTQFGISSSSSSSASSSSSSSMSSLSSSSSSSSSESSSSSSQSASSSSYAEADADAKSYLMDVGVTDNDDDYPRSSYFITGEYDLEMPGRIKEIAEIWPVVEELSNDIHLSIGSRSRISDDIVWEELEPYTDQEVMGTRSYGVYLSFRVEADGLDDFFRLSEICGYARAGGRR